jgi:two-component system nitrogen regulation sensor histidine kinase NtrY
VLTDISADVRAAEATALRDLLRVLNHELMNALTPVASMSKSALDLLGDDTPESRSLAVKALERVVARTENLSGFINAYRAMTRLPPPVLRPVRLDDWLDVAAESFAAQWGANVRLDHQLADVDLSAMMDEDQMWLCVGNLLNNAAQAALDNAQPPVVRLHVRGEDDGIAIHVEDSGKGIATDQADQVFLPFYTTKATGTGVGLSLARQIVQGHGSTLSLLPPAPGNADRLGGACFAFRLRAA